MLGATVFISSFFWWESRLCSSTWLCVAFCDYGSVFYWIGCGVWNEDATPKSLCRFASSYRHGCSLASPPPSITKRTERKEGTKRENKGKETCHLSLLDCDISSRGFWDISSISCHVPFNEYGSMDLDPSVKWTPFVGFIFVLPLPDPPPPHPPPCSQERDWTIIYRRWFSGWWKRAIKNRTSPLPPPPPALLFYHSAKGNFQ